MAVNINRHLDLTIHQAAEGGYVVMNTIDKAMEGRGCIWTPIVFAATSIDDALKFIRDKMEPPK